MADVERIKARLHNIRSVEPILGAMRTISLGSWQAALNRQGRLRLFSRRLLSLLPPVLAHLHKRRRKRALGSSHARQSIFLIVGSERGLCGAFNRNLVHYVQGQLDEWQTRDREVALWVFGSRARRMLERAEAPIAWFEPLPTTKLPGRELVVDLVNGWLEQYEAFELDTVYVLYNAYRNSTLYESVMVRLIPPDLPSAELSAEPSAIAWPPPYVDTDPVSLYTRIVRLWTTTEMYRLLLDSAAAEHSTRFQLMEGATQNSNRLINELTLALQSARQTAITSEMQELAVGAGLVGGGEE